MPLLDPYEYAFGSPGSRFRINTPGLILDLDAFERNLARMAAAMKGFGCGLRPHAKSHKSSQIARLQVEAGALGVCCATLDEAEVMVVAGLRGVLITSPVTTGEKIRRLMRLAAAAPDTMIVVDNTDNVRALSAAASAAGVSLTVLVDIELGFGRTGVLTVDAVEDLTRCVLAADGLSLGGVQAYGGHLQHIVQYQDRVAATGVAARFIERAIERLHSNGIATPLITGGGTGTHAIDGADGPFSEIQAGSYLFMDADYGAVDYGIDTPWPFEVSLFVQTAVTSCNVLGSVTVDAGTKALALNGPKPLVATPGLRDATYDFTGDEHGRISFGSHIEAPALGQRIELVVSHCDPTVAQYDAYHCVRGDALVDVWPIDARGRR